MATRAGSTASAVPGTITPPLRRRRRYRGILIEDPRARFFRAIFFGEISGSVRGWCCTLRVERRQVFGAIDVDGRLLEFDGNDPVWRQLLRDVRFRHALSLAIDRQAINETLFFGALTRAAVAKYQQAKDITPPVGYFGPKTRAAVNAEGGM